MNAYGTSWLLLAALLLVQNTHVMTQNTTTVAPVDGTTVETTVTSPAATTTEKNRSRFRELPGYNPNGFGFGGISRKIPSTTRTTRKPRVTFATTPPSVRVTARSPSTVAPRYQTHPDRSIIMKQTTDASSSPRQPVTATTPSTPPPPPTAPTTVLPPSSAICGGGIESDRGDIVSPDYPIGYKRGLVCYWNITVSQQAPRIKLEFLKLNLGLEDFVELKSYTGQVLRHYTGREKTKLFVTTTRQIAVLFVSKNDGLGKGFVLNYLATYAGPTRITNSAPYSPVMFLTESMGNLTSPNFPAPYYNLEDMRWVLIAPPGHVIAITLIGEDFYLENDYDYLLVGDGNLLENPIMNITGKLNSSLAYVFSDKTSKMWIQFKSDETNAKKGFRLYYSVMPIDVALTEMESATGSIASENYPRPYPAEAEIEWSMKVPDHLLPHVRLRMTIVDMDLGPNDYLLVGTGEMNAANLTQYEIMRGTSYKAVEFRFDSRTAVVRFHSSNSSQQTHRGFTLNWQTYDLGLAAIRKELAAMGITPANKPREVYVKPDYSKKEDDDEYYDDDMTTDEPTTTTPEPINGFVVVMIDGISKDLFNTNQNEFKRALAAAAALYCDEFDCQDSSAQLNSEDVGLFALDTIADDELKLEATISIQSRATEHGFALSDIELQDLIQMKAEELEAELGYRVYVHHTEKKAWESLPTWALFTIVMMVVLFTLFLIVLIYSGRKRMQRMTKLYKREHILSPDLTVYQRPIPPNGYRHKPAQSSGVFLHKERSYESIPGLKGSRTGMTSQFDGSSNHYENPTMILEELRAKREMADAAAAAAAAAAAERGGDEEKTDDTPSVKSSKSRSQLSLASQLSSTGTNVI